jgi:predicted MFS family arabinose efflux permease
MQVGLIIETLTHLSLALTHLSLALTRSTVIALAVMFVFGIHAEVWGVTASSVRQRAVPTRLQGRVSSVYVIAVQGGIVADGALGGIIAEQFGVTRPFWFAFIGSAIFLAIIWHQLPNIADREGTDNPEGGPLQRSPP